MDETIARRIDYRVVRPDGTLVWTHATSSLEGVVPTARRDGSFAPPGSLDSAAPPFLIQRLDGDDWTTIERCGACVVVGEHRDHRDEYGHEWSATRR